MPCQSRIVTLSNWLYWLVIAGLLALVPLSLWLFYQAWVQPDWLAGLINGLPPETVFGPERSVAVTLLGCLAFLPLLFALLQMRNLFGRYRRGEILTEVCASHILRIGQWLMATAVATLILPTLQILVLTYDNPPGTRMLSMSISSTMIAVLLIAGLLTVIGWALRDAARIADENASFV